jgi:hypothetical protein
MVSGDWDETRAFARLPNLDIAFLHRAGREREEIMLALRVADPFAARPYLAAASPVLFWMQLSQAFYRAWLGYLTAAGLPHLID